MKILTLHCDYIRFKPLKKALKSIEDLEDKEEKEVNEVLVVLTAIEKGDSEEELKKSLESIKKTAGEVKTKSIVLYPYAHLSSDLANPDLAQEFLKKAEDELNSQGFSTTKAPFGYYKQFELKVKGHPLSELSKTFKPENQEIKIVQSNSNSSEKTEDPKQLLREISRSKLDTSKLKDNDHRILGQKLDLFSFNESAPGQPFWHKNGQTIFLELQNFMRSIIKEDYEEIVTPQIFDNKLWKISGHWGHYKENMFVTNYESRDFGVKPMNCPGMILVYKTKTRSYKDLPIRLFEFGRVHRQELSGVLAGLFRAISFTQDDAHIFCEENQIPNEMEKILDIIKKVYKDTFGFNYHLELSTRPEKFLGDKKVWDFAEKSLEDVLKAKKVKYKINKGDGAFYGPKIDLHIEDSLGRTWQCATIQLDMQMPSRFEVEYIGNDNKPHTPIMIHRAVFGSIERFIGILLEHTSGALPVWLSPTQVKIISFTDRNIEATEKILKELNEKIPEARISLDNRNTTVNEKIRDAELQKIPYIIVIGDKEEEAKTLAVRKRGDKKPKFGIKPEDFVNELSDKIMNRDLS